MTPLPKRRLSTARQGNRRASFSVKTAGLAKCAHCGKLKQGHTRCKECGFYK
ncbi:50S ribosomal protein L32 [Candidatus Gottesmanbacteria bacterium RIFCSPHIGHO2_01_FULL_42_12]|uniref:Large ribosomal subunit protein bL32 n=1 Tax=Candidatus Gottesmanbacteria bacterium RIFCSPHIGHO2_01_FULL_42_12 TaxID=1798377 RepID=A0A1F5Z1V9_9BACT|nr:MAG: 50S ribosomal protein L32 [Candidatus Gottesmanbacteria bacterium RIFCSPHIGHO2_01_FULL_42_12]